jgi:uncharacterized protein YbdZ (MbtH family)
MSGIFVDIVEFFILIHRKENYSIAYGRFLFIHKNFNTVLHIKDLIYIMLCLSPYNSTAVSSIIHSVLLHTAELFQPQYTVCFSTQQNYSIHNTQCASPHSRTIPSTIHSVLLHTAELFHPQYTVCFSKQQNYSIHNIQCASPHSSSIHNT